MHFKDCTSSVTIIICILCVHHVIDCKQTFFHVIKIGLIISKYTWKKKKVVAFMLFVTWSQINFIKEETRNFKLLKKSDNVNMMLPFTVLHTYTGHVSVSKALHTFLVHMHLL
jgi:hypothetical protein